MRVKFLVVLGCLLWVSSVVSAQQVESTHLFPGAARLAGQPPSQWVSDVTVNNLEGYSIEMGLLFLPERTEHGVQDIVVQPQHRFVLGPRETRVFEDVLGTLFGLDSAKGMLLVTCEAELLQIDPPGDNDPRIMASMRTYDVSSPVGTYGQSIPSNGFILNSSGHQSFVTGAVNNSNFRSNLGILNLSLHEVTIHYRVFSATAIVVEGQKSLGSLWIQQWSFNSLGVGTVQGPLTVDLWIDPDDVRNGCLDIFEGGSAFAAYVSKVDSRTQDAEFLWAAPAWVAEIECD